MIDATLRARGTDVVGKKKFEAVDSLVPGGHFLLGAWVQANGSIKVCVHPAFEAHCDDEALDYLTSVFAKSLLALRKAGEPQ